MHGKIIPSRPHATPYPASEASRAHAFLRHTHTRKLLRYDTHPCRVFFLEDFTTPCRRKFKARIPVVAPAWPTCCRGVALWVSCRMKKLNPGNKIVIPSNLPRTRHGPDRRGPRICVLELGRSCALGQGFIVFTDGSAYSYDPPSSAPFEMLCASPQRGKDFNHLVRRAASGYIKNFVPPTDYQAIYDYPPYAGIAPIPCVSPGINWNDIVWQTFALTSGDPSGFASATFNPAHTFYISVMGAAPFPGGASANPFVRLFGTLVYLGPAVDCVISLDGVSFGTGPAFLSLDIQQDGNPLISYPGGPFTVADTGGVGSTLTVDVQLVGFTGDATMGTNSGGGNLTGALAPAF